MIRALRRRHRWMIPMLFLLVFAASLLALVRPAPSARVDALPPALAGAEGSTHSR